MKNHTTIFTVIAAMALSTTYAQLLNDPSGEPAGRHLNFYTNFGQVIRHQPLESVTSRAPEGEEPPGDDFIVKYYNRNTIPASYYLPGNNGFAYITGATQCNSPASSSNYCKEPASGNGDFPLCPGNGLFFQVDANGNPVFGGSNPRDGYMAGFNTSNQLIWCTWFGGNGEDHMFSLASGQDKLYMTGRTAGWGTGNIPLEDLGNNAYWQPTRGGQIDALITRFDVSSATISLVENDPGEALQYLQVFPNPTQNRVTVKLAHFNNKDEGALQLIDPTGKTISQFVLNGAEMEVDLAGLAPGMYLLQLEYKGTVETRKLLKQ